MRCLRSTAVEMCFFFQDVIGNLRAIATTMPVAIEGTTGQTAHHCNRSFWRSASGNPNEVGEPGNGSTRKRFRPPLAGPPNSVPAKCRSSRNHPGWPTGAPRLRGPVWGVSSESRSRAASAFRCRFVANLVYRSILSSSFKRSISCLSDSFSATKSETDFRAPSNWRCS